jgi:hypothetical protein
MKLSNVRLAFPSLWKKDKMEGSDGEPKYKATFIIPKDHPQLGEVKAMITKCKKDKWGDQNVKPIPFLRNGEEKDNLDGFDSSVMFFNASNPRRFVVVDRDRSILVEEDGKPYAGCYVNIIIDAWAQDNKKGKRVNCELQGVQFAGDGERFGGGGGSAEADDFDDISSEAEEADDWGDDAKATEAEDDDDWA